MKKRMRKEERNKMVESDHRINELRNGGLENRSRFQRLDGSKILECILSKSDLFLERGLRWHCKMFNEGIVTTYEQ